MVLIWLNKMLTFHYSAMNAGKTTMLLGSAHNYEQKGKKILLLNSILDTRYGSQVIKSRTGISKPCTSYTKDEDLSVLVLSKLPLDCIFVDESQFLTITQVWQLFHLSSKHGLEIKCYGLRTDFNGNMFEGSQQLLALADELVHVKTICNCGKFATMNRLLEKGNVDQIQIGGDEKYVSECPKCWIA